MNVLPPGFSGMIDFGISSDLRREIEGCCDGFSKFWQTVNGMS
jgi:hypothetical protein